MMVLVTIIMLLVQADLMKARGVPVYGLVVFAPVLMYDNPRTISNIVVFLC